MTSQTQDEGGIAGVTRFVHNGDGQVLTRTAKSLAAGEGDQTTTYFYNTSSDDLGTKSAELATTRLLAGLEGVLHRPPRPWPAARKRRHLEK